MHDTLISYKTNIVGHTVTTISKIAQFNYKMLKNTETIA